MIHPFMEIIYGIDNLKRALRDTVVSLGIFDGVHLGHQKIFRLLGLRKAERKGKSVVITFDPHPSKVLPGRKSVSLITPLPRRLELIASFGVDLALCVEFTLEFSRIRAREFVEKIIWDRLHPQLVLVGQNFNFGRGREGTPEMLKELGTGLGFEAEVVEPVTLGRSVVSSSGIRDALRAGQVEQAEEMLGRPFDLAGTVIGGRKVGRELGFPTANLNCQGELYPKNGVYACTAQVGQARYLAAVNIGTAPTIEGREFSVEAFLLDYQGELYGETISVYFHHRLRDEKKFANLEELKGQIEEDVEATRSLLAERLR